MKLHYYPETDSLYIELKEIPSVETREVTLGLNVDLHNSKQSKTGEPTSEAAE